MHAHKTFYTLNFSLLAAKILTAVSNFFISHNAISQALLITSPPV